MTTLNHPWQYGPTELIEHAIEHMHKGTDFDMRIAFLLFDVGVETLLKTFLTLPDTVTRTTMKFQERQSAADGGFHAVAEGVRKAAHPGKISEVNLDEIKFYHSKRNTLYHDGNGITVPAELVKKYASAVVYLLKNLLDVDLSNELNLPTHLESIRTRNEELSLLMNNKRIQVNEALEKIFREQTLLVVEQLAPKVTQPTFKKKLTDIYSKHVEDWSYINENGIEILYNHIEYPENFFSEIISLLQTSIENEILKNKLFNSEYETDFIKDLQSCFKDYENLVICLAKHGANKSLSWSNFELTTTLEYIQNHENFEDFESRYKSFLLEAEKVTQEIQLIQKKYEKWLSNHT